ncbi:MAG: SPOR domain-containing protein, partial [Bacteroidales bacterium]|nr:SPOR domain-containing protein [Bacteroidales bacterium]
VLQNGSKFGLTASLIKQFNSWFAIQIQYGIGSLYSLKTAANTTLQTEMSGSISEFGLAGRFDPLPLFLSGKEPLKISPYITLGVSTLGYRSVRRDFTTHNIYNPAIGYKADGVTKAPRENALAIPMGLGLSYRITPKLAVEGDYAIRLTNTDLLDALVGNTNINDFYSFTTLGLRYYFDQNSAPARRTNRSVARKVPLTRNKSRKSSAGLADNLPLTNIFVESKIPENVSNGRIFEVLLRINKGTYKGPGKLIQTYPRGFTAMESQGSYAKFSFTNHNAIINWDQMPADSVVTYTYHVRVGETASGNQTIAGRFEYQQPDGQKVNRFNNYIFVENKLEDQMDQRVKAILGEDSKTPVKKVNTNVTINEGDQYNARIDDILKQYSSGEQTKTNVTNTNVVKYQPVQGVEYKIQVGAFRDKSQGGTRLARKYGITESLSEEYTNGWYKYTVGSFRSYNEAVRFRNSFINKTKLWSAFIVAYKNGKRLPRISDAVK